MRQLGFAVFFAVVAALPATAQTQLYDSDGRYTYQRVGDDVLRLDARTGQVSRCTRQAGAWACEAAPDDRSKLESEVARLRDENAVALAKIAAEKASLDAEVARLRSEGAALQKTVGEHLALQAELTRLRVDNSELKKAATDRAALSAEMARLREDGDALRKAVADRSAMEVQIAQMQDEIIALRKASAERDKAATTKPGEVRMRLPSQDDVDRMVTYMESIWRRLIQVIVDVQADMPKQKT